MFKPRFATALLLLAVLAHGDAFAASNGMKDRLLAERFVMATTPQTRVDLSFQDENGRQLSLLRDFKGHYVLLNVWATWCGPCVKEMPALNALQEHLAARQVALIALSEDRQGQAKVANFYQGHELKNLAIYVDEEGAAMDLLELRGVPTTLLIGPDGREIGRVENALDWMKPENLAWLDTMTGDKAR